MSVTAGQECDARLDDGQELRCDRNAPHHNKPHRATGSWMTSDERHVSATVTWSVGGDEWSDLGGTA